MKYKLKSPIDTGQKEQVSALVRQIIPSHNVWCEPYFHSGEVFFKKKPSKKEIINDADGNVTNFYLMIRNRWEQLFFLMESTLQCDFFSRLAQRITDDEKADFISANIKSGVPDHLADNSFQRFLYNSKITDRPDLVDDDTLDKMTGTEIFRTVNDVYNKEELLHKLVRKRKKRRGTLVYSDVIYTFDLGCVFCLILAKDAFFLLFYNGLSV